MQEDPILNLPPIAHKYFAVVIFKKDFILKPLAKEAIKNFTKELRACALIMFLCVLIAIKLLFKLLQLHQPETLRSCLL